MNHVERFRAVMDFKKFDRLPRIEWAMWWDQTIARWKKEGLPEDLEDVFEITKFLGLDPYKQFWMNTRCPSMEAEQQSIDGRVKDFDDYNKIKSSLFPVHTDAFEQMAVHKEQQENGDILIWTRQS